MGWRRTGLAFGLIATILAWATLIQSLLGINLAIDNLLVRHEALIADVTIAVYEVVLGEARPANWLDLELALWGVVRNRLEAWGLFHGGACERIHMPWHQAQAAAVPADGPYGLPEWDESHATVCAGAPGR